MTKNRLENFSDAVIAIILTIMVLELRIPHTTAWGSILELYPLFIAYGLSFAFIGIYWINHHHLIHAVGAVNSRILWANMLLLFCLSLIPWATGFMGENHFEQNSVIVYTLLCMLPAIAYSFLSSAIIRSKNPNTQALRILQKTKTKEYMSLALYVLALVSSFWNTSISLSLIFIVSCIWIIPNKQIEEIFD
ncbi:MAG: DUF1211 domain-containing protein [Candidatus Ryanbacteria bacterium]|nr:DUF1211 domain-containing protein [Candidatus Ryanbacteria bacterium]